MILPALIASNPFGTIDEPPGVRQYNDLARASGGEIGLLIFMNRLITVVTVVAGIWVLFNIVLAGFNYVTSSGDTGAHKKARDNITMSILGLVFIVASYTIMAIVGLLLFNDPAYFLNPTITGP